MEGVLSTAAVVGVSAGVGIGTGFPVVVLPRRTVVGVGTGIGTGTDSPVVVLPRCTVVADGTGTYSPVLVQPQARDPSPTPMPKMIGTTTNRTTMCFLS